MGLGPKGNKPALDWTNRSFALVKMEGATVHNSLMANLHTWALITHPHTHIQPIITPKPDTQTQ